MTFKTRGTHVTTISLPWALMRKVDDYVRELLSVPGKKMSRNALIRKAVAEFFDRRENIGAQFKEGKGDN